jgi:hypothetical protein
MSANVDKYTNIKFWSDAAPVLAVANVYVDFVTFVFLQSNRS